MRFDRVNAMQKYVPMSRRQGAAVLALLIAVGFAAPAAADPTFSPITGSSYSIPTGQGVYLPVVAMFNNPGTNPKYTSYSISNTDYVDSSRTGYSSGIRIVTQQTGTLAVGIKKGAELAELDDPPSYPFEFQVTMSMANDEGETASGTLTLTVTRGH